MKIRRPDGGALIIEFDLPTTTDEQWFLLRSDVHFDNPKSDRAMETRHLEQARERGAKVLDFGDLFDAMQGPGDPRSDRSIIRTEEGRAAYFNTILSDAADFYEPYADLFASMSWGNHETTPVKRYGIDLTAWLIAALRDRTRHTIHHMPYAGWVRFHASTHGTMRESYVLRYTHGSGGGGEVTRGTIKGQRAVAAYDADIYYTGHIHERWMLDRPAQFTTRNGIIKNRTRWTISAPGYKEASIDGNSWEQTRDMPPKPKGAVWLRFWVDRKRLMCTPSWAE